MEGMLAISKLQENIVLYFVLLYQIEMMSNDMMYYYSLVRGTNGQPTGSKTRAM